MGAMRNRDLSALKDRCYRIRKKSCVKGGIAVELFTDEGKHVLAFISGKDDPELHAMLVEANQNDVIKITDEAAGRLTLCDAAPTRECIRQFEALKERCNGKEGVLDDAFIDFMRKYTGYELLELIREDAS